MTDSQEGETALYRAADNGQEHCALALLEAGCDPNILTVHDQPLTFQKKKPKNHDLVPIAVKYFDNLNPLRTELDLVKFFLTLTC